MIQINNLKKSFGETVACDIPSLTINDGDLLGLVGNNGAGKTTLFRLMLDLLQADSGNVTYTFPVTGEEGAVVTIDPATSEDWKQPTAAHIDDSFLIDYLTPEEYFAFLAKLSGMAQSKVDERLKDFEHFAGGEVLGQKKLIRNLSAGNKQKVGIIAALIRQPKLVILDEPFNFLDPTSQSILKHMLTDYNKQTGATILLSSHNLQHTIDISTRIVLLEKGHVINDIAGDSEEARQQLVDYFEEKA
jgi:ABC-2 type transport system ATP-binding protein